MSVLNSIQLKCAMFLHFFCRVVMASSCVKLCLRCRSLLWTWTVPSAWQHCTQFQGSTTFIRVINGPLSSKRYHTTTQAGSRWKHQMLYHSDLTAKHLSTEATNDKYAEELSKVNNNSPLVPITDNVPVTQSEITVGM